MRDPLKIVYARFTVVLFINLLCCGAALAIEKITLWPTIFFLRGQDLCQYQDAYGSSRNEQITKSVNHLKELISLGVTASEASHALQEIDGLIDKNKQMAAEGDGMDITLEATLKAAVNAVSRNINPQNTRLEFANPGSVQELIQGLKSKKRFESEDLVQLSKVRGFLWGTYSYSPGCKGDVLVTIHAVLPKGESVSFQDQGKPENVMTKIALQIVRHFQKTSFPSMIMLENKILVLIGAPGTSVNQAPTPKIAKTACKMFHARLPTMEEYEYLSILGDWNGGISLDHLFWALNDTEVLSPDTRNPSPVRKHAEVHFSEVNFYCVK